MTNLIGLTVTTYNQQLAKITRNEEREVPVELGQVFVLKTKTDFNIHTEKNIDIYTHTQIYTHIFNINFDFYDYKIILYISFCKSRILTYCGRTTLHRSIHTA